MKRSFRLTQSNDFKRVRRIGKSYAHPFIVLVAAPNGLARLRIAVVAGGRVGKAVQRNRVKRRMRAILHAMLPTFKTGWDLIFIARQPAAAATYSELQAGIAKLVQRAGLILADSHDQPAA